MPSDHDPPPGLWSDAARHRRASGHFRTHRDGANRDRDAKMHSVCTPSSGGPDPAAMNWPEPDSREAQARSQAAAEWLARRDQGLSGPEQDAFFEWLATDPRHG